MDDKTLLAVHTRACTAVARVDRTLDPADDRFWPLYLRAALVGLMPVTAELRDLITPGALAVLSERRRQVVGEGFNAAHDAGYDSGELAAASAAYALAAADRLHPFSQGDGGYEPGSPPVMWPWDTSWWKPTTAQRNLEKAAALAIAELDLLLSPLFADDSRATKGDEPTAHFVRTITHNNEVWQGGAKLASATSYAIANEIANALNDRSFWGHYYVCLPCMDKWLDNALGDAEEFNE